MTTLTYTPDLAGKRVIKTEQEQHELLFYSGHPCFLIPDFLTNPTDPSEDIWIGVINYLEKQNGGELYDQNGGEIMSNSIVDLNTGLTQCQYIADGIVFNEGDEPQNVTVDVEGYVVEDVPGTCAIFVATKVVVHDPVPAEYPENT